MCKILLAGERVLDVLFELVQLCSGFDYLYLNLFLKFESFWLKFIYSFRVDVIFNQRFLHFGHDLGLGLSNDVSHKLLVDAVIQFGFAIIDLP